MREGERGCPLTALGLLLASIGLGACALSLTIVALDEPEAPLEARLPGSAAEARSQAVDGLAARGMRLERDVHGLAPERTQASPRQMGVAMAARGTSPADRVCSSPGTTPGTDLASALCQAAARIAATDNAGARKPGHDPRQDLAEMAAARYGGLAYERGDGA